jgi:hypothetical protein
MVDLDAVGIRSYLGDPVSAEGIPSITLLIDWLLTVPKVVESERRSLRYRHRWKGSTDT